jgi:hypothetical protein
MLNKIEEFSDGIENRKGYSYYRLEEYDRSNKITFTRQSEKRFQLMKYSDGTFKAGPVNTIDGEFDTT